MSIKQVSAELAAKAAVELNEDPSRTSSDIKSIREWFSKQPHLADINISDQRILTFLRGCKFSIEKCKQKLDMYFTMKNLAPELMANRDPMNPKLQEVLKDGITLPFSKLRSSDAERVYMVRLGKANMDKYSLADVLKVSFMITDILLEEDDNYVIGGQLLFVDMKDLTLSLATQFTPTLAKKTTMTSQKVYPIRQNGYHMTNMSGFDTFFNLLKSFLSEKLKKRIYVYNSKMEGLDEYIPKNIMPKDMGGEGESTEELTEYWKKKVESYRDWFIKEDTYKSDEKKRPGKPKTTEEMFGMEGSFRKLELD